jgi:organic radical activating enzyme
MSAIMLSMKQSKIICEEYYDSLEKEINPDPFRKVESVYMSGAEQLKKKLDQISPSLCMAKWLQVSLHLTTGRTQSCYHPPTHAIPINELKENSSALHNTEYKKSQRAQMLKGKRPAECSYCWKMEDLGHLSDRHYRSSEEWSAPFFEEVLSAGSEKNVNPKYVEVNFNHACNLKCSYCSPHISSSWLDEIKKFGPYSTIEKHNSLDWIEQQGLMPSLQSEKNPYAEAFWKWWPDLYKDLKVFRMTGGEPLMDINTYKVLDYIIQNPKRDLKISITSNMSSKPEFIEKFISKVKIISDARYSDRFTLFVSCDSVGAQAEYIRNGLNYDYFIENVDRFLTEVKTGVVSFIVTMNNLSGPGLNELMKKILELRKKHSRYFQRVWFDTPMLRFPSWQSLQILPMAEQQYVVDTMNWMQQNPMIMASTQSRLHGFHDYEIARLQRVLDWMKQGISDAEQLKKERANFYRFFSEHDLRRNTNFEKTFPELQDFWKLCQQVNRENFSS